MNYAYLGLRGSWDFYNSMRLIFVLWLRRSFLLGEIFFNSRILRDHFLIGLPLIRVNRGVQDISLYTYVWRPNKAMSDSSKVCLLPTASFCQLLIPSMCFSRLVQMLLGLKAHSLASRWNHRLYTWLFMKARPTSSSRPSPLPNMDKFINIINLPLSLYTNHDSKWTNY